MALNTSSLGCIQPARVSCISHCVGERIPSTGHACQLILSVPELVVCTSGPLDRLGSSQSCINHQCSRMGQTALSLAIWLLLGESSLWRAHSLSVTSACS